VSTPPAAGVRPIDPGPFRLTLRRHDVAPGGGLDAVRLDRRLAPFGPRWNVPLAARLATGLLGGFQFDREDSDTKAWYPQGIDGDGRRLLVSWYAKAGGARVSVVDLAGGRYGHVPLVTADAKPVKSHAGGLAWRGDLLYVADTKRLLVFDLRACRADGLPRCGVYEPAGGLRFSFVSVDRDGGALLAGEYTDKTPGARLVRWPFGPDGWLAQEPASDAWVTAHANLQGALALRGALLLAASRGPVREGTLTATPFAESARHRRWATGCEDLADVGGEVVSLTEHPDLPWPLARRRSVFRASGP
jgi:hypothetical protein